MLRTALVIGGDTKEAQAALGQLESSIEQSEAAARKLSSAWTAVDVSTTKLAQAQAVAAGQIEQTKADYDAGRISLERYNQELLETKTGLQLVEAEHRKNIATLKDVRAANVDLDDGMQQLNKGASAQTMGMQQLSFQLNDVATMYALGAKPQQIFASQAGQVFQAINMVSGSSTGLLGILGNPWVAVVGTAAIALLPLIANLWDTEDAMGAVGAAADAAMAKLRQSFAEVNDFQAAISSSQTQLLNGMGSLAKANRDIAQTTRLMNEMVSTPGAGNAAEGLAMRLAQAQAAKAAAERDIAQAKANFEEIRTLRGVQQIQQRNQDRLNDASTDKAVGNSRRRTAALSDEAKAAQRQFDVGQQYIQSLQDEADRVGLTARQLRVLELAKAQEAAATDAQREAMAAAWSEREKAIVQQEKQARLDELKKQQEGADAEVARANREAQALGLVGRVREQLLDQLEHEAEIAPLLEQLAEARRKGLTDEAAAIEKLIATKQQAYAQDQQNKDSAFYDEEAIKNAELFNEQLSRTVQLLQGIGGFAGTVGDLLAFVSGDYRSVSGPLGELLDLPISREIDETGKEVITRLGDRFRDIMGEHASAVIAAIMQNGALGVAGAQAVLGQQGVGGQIGAGIGGIVAGEFKPVIQQAATQFLGKLGGDLIGAAVPIVGGILGSLAGDLIGKLIGGADRGAAIISNGQVTGTYGDTQKYKDQASQLAGGLLDTMQQIASQFGAKLDAEAMGKLSIGIRDGNYVLDPQGRGYTKTSKYSDLQSFGKDADAAYAAAIELMIERGAIEMREGSLKLIKEATDLQTGLEKALAFDQIMDQLEGGNSQLVAQVRATRTQFTQWISVMKEAGASVADLTRVQAMQQAQIEAMIAAAGASYRGTFYTDQQNVDFAKQTIAAALTPLGKADIDTVAEYMAAVEAAQKDTSEAGLAWLDTLYQLSDEFAVLKQAADQAAAAAAAEAAQKEAERAAAAAAAKAERERLAAEKARNIEAAKSDLRAAYERSAAERQATIDSMKASAGAIGDVMAQIMGTGDAGGTFERAQALLRETAYKANVQGDQGAIAQLSGVLGDYWSAAQAQASSALELERMRAEALRVGQSGINSADAIAQMQQEALDAEKAQVGLLIDLNEGAQTIAQAIAALAKLTGTAPTTGGGNTPTPTPTPGGSNGGTPTPRPPGTRPNRGRGIFGGSDGDGLEGVLGDLRDSLDRQRQFFDRFDGNTALKVKLVPDDDEEEGE